MVLPHVTERQAGCRELPREITEDHCETLLKQEFFQVRSKISPTTNLVTRIVCDLDQTSVSKEGAAR